MKATEQVKAILSQLEAAGTLTADTLVAIAADPASPLHAHFEWDDAVAAHRHRQEQARVLIRSIKMQVTHHSLIFEAPTFISNPSLGGGYISLPRLRRDEEASRDAVVAEFARAASALSRARTIAAALGLEDEIEGLREQVIGLSDRIELGAAGTA